MGDVAVVDQERRERHAGVGERGAHLAEIGGLAAFQMEVADLQMVDAAAARPPRGSSMSVKLARSPFRLGVAGDVVCRRVRMENAERAVHAPA